MKFIPELTEQVQAIITEAKDGTGPKQYYLEGIYVQGDLANRNNRYYPINVLLPEVKRYSEELIDKKRSLGELGHPDSGSINLDRVSHMITSLRQEGKNFIGRAKLMDTPCGKIAKNFVDEGVQLGVSTRGFGSLQEGQDGINIVGPDFHLATVDIVADPSGPNCFVQGIMENKEWMLKEGVLVEMQADKIKKIVKNASKAQLDEGLLLKLFEDFLNGKI